MLGRKTDCEGVNEFEAVVRGEIDWRNAKASLTALAP